MSGEDTNNQEQSPRPNPDLKSLDRLVGKWNVFDPTGKDEIRGTVTFEWMEGGFFLMQHVDFEHNGHKIKGLEIIGHEKTFGFEESQDIKSRYYDSTGDTLDYVYELEGDILTIWGGQKGSPAYFKGKFSEDGNSNTGGWVYPGGGGYAASLTKVILVSTVVSPESVQYGHFLGQFGIDLANNVTIEQHCHQQVSEFIDR